MSNKLHCQQLKNIIRSLKDAELEEMLAAYEQIAKMHLEKTCRMISYKWYFIHLFNHLISYSSYEASVIYNGRKASGTHYYSLKHSVITSSYT